VSASLLPAAGLMQAGLAAAVGATSTGGTGCTALVEVTRENSVSLTIQQQRRSI